MMPMAEKSRTPDWKEVPEQMVRVVATWSSSLIQLVRLVVTFWIILQAIGGKRPALRIHLDFKVRERELFIYPSFLSLAQAPFCHHLISHPV
jgi:hypothetical protein